MPSEVTKAVYGLTSEREPITAAGAAYELRQDFVPTLLSAEAEESLEWLLRNGLVVAQPDQGFGTEYLRKPRE